MHEQWKKRKMFSNKEQGIMSGLDSVPMMAGGFVPYPGMQDGGEVPKEPSIEERVAALAAAQGIDVGTARGQLLQATAEQQGLSLPETAVQQFSVGLISLTDALAQGIPKMEVGGVVPKTRLFEEGDNELNESLNMMASVTNPDVPDMPATNGTSVIKETMTEDQGPINIKKTYQELAMQSVEVANDAIEQGAPVEQVKQPLQDRLLLLDDQYRQKSGESDTILTDEFLTRLSTMSEISAESIPGMQGGGTVSTDEEVNSLVNNLTVQSLIPQMLATANRAKRGTMMAGKSKQGGVSGLMDVLGQSEVAAADAIGEAERAALSQLGATERTTISDTGATERIKQQLSKPISLTEAERDLARGGDIYAQQLFSKRLGDRTDINDVVEEFIENGIPLPKVIGVAQGSFVENGKIITFSDFYKASKADKPERKFEEIAAAWQIALNKQSNT